MILYWPEKGGALVELNRAIPWSTYLKRCVCVPVFYFRCFVSWFTYAGRHYSPNVESLGLHLTLRLVRAKPLHPYGPHFHDSLTMFGRDNY